MTSQSPRIYLYKITFEEVPYYYYGVHKEKRYDEYYMGSPITHKWCWELYTPKKQILEVFPYTDEGWIEAQEIEKRLIKPFYNTDKWCLNENCGGLLSLETCINSGKINGKKIKELGLGVHGRTKEQMTEDGIKGGKISGKKAKELGLGVHGRTKEQMTKDGIKGGKIGGKKAKELGLGVHGRTKGQMSEDGKKGGKKAKELGVGIFGLTAEQTIENVIKGGKIGGKKAKELGVGIHGRTKDQMTEDGKKGGKIGGKIGSKKTNSQKWMCCETGYVSTSAGISQYQKARGIDISNRIRIE
jgi:hypothetical protein